MIISPQFNEEGVQMEIGADCCAPDVCIDFEFQDGFEDISFRLLEKNAKKLAQTILNYLDNLND